jgi:hypothetical protein
MGHRELAADRLRREPASRSIPKLLEGRVDDIRQCVGAAYCIDRIYVGNDALCIQNAATGREQTMPHFIGKAEKQRRVVVVGGGPAGLEAARVSAERGHRVVLFEKSKATGGQVSIAAKATWREALTGITRWLTQQVGKRGVDVRLGAEATPDLIAAEDPDVVILATGGRPSRGGIKGADLAATTWDMLTGTVTPAEHILIYDGTGQHHASSCAEFLAKRGARVEIATLDRMIGEEIGATNQPIHLRELMKLDVLLSPNLQLVEIYAEGNRRVAVLRNEYTHAEEERLIDQVVVEFGTLPEDALYFAMKDASFNRGEVDLQALLGGRPQPAVNGAGGFALFRIGDAVVGRNIRAAIYDAARLCKDI